MEKTFIVTGTDKDTNERFEYEESTLAKAMEIYNSLKDADDIAGLVVLEYNCADHIYHMAYPIG